MRQNTFFVTPKKTTTEKRKKNVIYREDNVRYYAT